MFETTNLQIVKAKMEDAQRLTTIQNSWENQELITGNHGADVDYFIKAVTEGHIPPNGKQKNYHILAVKEKINSEIIGLLEIYLVLQPVIP